MRNSRKHLQYDIISISHFFYPRKGGLEYNAYNLLKYLTKKGLKCIAVYGSEEKHTLKREGFTWKSFNPPKIFKGTYPLFGIIYFIYLYRLVRTNKEARIIIHSRHLTSSVIAALVCKLQKRDYVLVETTAAGSFFNYKIFDYISRILDRHLFIHVVSNASKIIAVSKGTKSFIQKTFNIPSEKIEVIYNGVNPTEIYTLSQDSKENIVLFAARWIVVKDPGTVYKAFESLSKRFPGWNFIMISELVPAQVLNLEREENFSLTNKLLSHNQLMRLLNKSKIAINSSLSEGLSHAVIEAIAMGNIPVLSDAPSNKEIAKIVKTTQYIFKRKSVRSLEEKITKAIEAKGSSAEDISALAINSFSTERLYEQYKGILLATNQEGITRVLSESMPLKKALKTVKQLIFET